MTIFYESIFSTQNKLNIKSSRLSKMGMCDSFNANHGALAVFSKKKRQTFLMSQGLHPWM